MLPLLEKFADKVFKEKLLCRIAYVLLHHFQLKIRMEKSHDFNNCLKLYKVLNRNETD